VRVKNFGSSRRNFMKTASQAALGCWAAARLPAPAVSPESVASTGLVFDERYLEHILHHGHPESPERLAAISRRLTSTGLDQELIKIAPSSADPLPYISAVHPVAHITRVHKQANSEAICRLAVSGSLAAVDAVCTGKVRNAFCAVRPPGHHAAANGEYGFCFYNNVAVAARYAQQKYGLAKILIVDWDYHHGDGTEWAFYSDPTVLFFSTHALSAFPGTGSAERTGSGAGAGYNINVPLPRGADDALFLMAFEQQLVPAAEMFRPDLVLISAGFDSRAGDPLGDFAVTDAGFAELTRLVMRIAATFSRSRIVSVLEGGYNPEGLALAVEAHIRALMRE
jgi:acetoin utilization deacetylase AcuC-like enzyme